MLDATAIYIERGIVHEDSASFSYDREFQDVILEVEPHLMAQPYGHLVSHIRSAFEAVGIGCGRNIEDVSVREVIPRVGANWREQLARELKGGSQSNHARKVRLEPRHPTEDGLHFTNEWEHRVYQVLKERQVTLPDNETIGIMPLGGMRVRGHTFEPDLLVTYRGHAGVIEIDGPQHKGRASADRSRERLLRHAGLKYIDRLDVEETTSRAEVEKFVTDFLTHLGR